MTSTIRKYISIGGRSINSIPMPWLWNIDNYYSIDYSEIHGKIIKFTMDMITAPELTGFTAVMKLDDFNIIFYAKGFLYTIVIYVR